MSIDHYTVPIPLAAFICSDWTSLIEEVRTKWGHCMLDKKYGGYVIEDEGAIVLVCTDDLCTILEEKDRQAQTITFHDPASKAVSLANYTIHIPPSARICSDWPSLEAAAKQIPGSRIVEKYGGFVIEGDGVIVFACDEKMSEEVGRSGDLVGMLYHDIVGEGEPHLQGEQIYL
jgi:hypothetical protein